MNRTNKGACHASPTLPDPASSLGRNLITVTFLAMVCSFLPGLEASTPRERNFPPGAAVMRVVEDAYHYLHENPELGKSEILASEYIRGKLKEYPSVELHTIEGLPTAVIGVIDTKRPGKIVAFRAELDARRLDKGEEPEAHTPRSKIPGLMHNCGHDAHAAMLLGLAYTVSRSLRHYGGKIVLVFQPAEESAGGADDIVNSGLLHKLGVTQIYSQHVAAHLPVGVLEFSRGTFLAGSTKVEVTIDGQGGHAAMPFNTSDVPLTTARIALDLSEYPARHFDTANSPVVLSFAHISSGKPDQSNVLPGSGYLVGTLRTFENPFGDNETSIASVLDARLQSLAATFHVTAQLKLTPGAPPTTNNDELLDLTVATLRKQWSNAENIKLSRDRYMVAEDFSYYTPVFRSLYWSIGISKEGLGDANVHSASFTIHPDALKYGLAALVITAREATRSGK